MASHPIERAKERYGLDLTEHDIDMIRLRLSRQTCLRRLDDGQEVHPVTYGGQLMLVGARMGLNGCYRICTFLPPEFFNASYRKAGRGPNVQRGSLARSKRDARVRERLRMRGMG